MTDNFSSEYAQINPILGQTWYNSKTKKINVHKKDSWFEISLVPNTDNLNIIYNTVKGVHGSMVLADELVKYIPLSGNSTHVPILSSKLEFTNPKEAVTKQYVDTTLTSGYVKYLPKMGSSATMSGPLRIMDVNHTDAPNIAVNIGYVNDLGKVSTITNNSRGLPLSVTQLYSYRITSHKVSNKKNDKGELTLDDVFTTVFFKAKLGTTENTDRFLSFELPFSYKKLDTDRYSMNIVVNTIGINKRISVKSINGSTITIDKLEYSMVPLEVHGSIFGFTNNETDATKYVSNPISGSRVGSVQYSTDDTINALLYEKSVNWNFVAPFRTTLYYTFDIKVKQDDTTLPEKYLKSEISEFNEVQKTATRHIFNHVHDIIGIKFEEVNDGTLADFHFCNADIPDPVDKSGTTLASCSSPKPIFKTDDNNEITEFSQDSFIYVDNVEGVLYDTQNPISGNAGYHTILHEIGHALGLKHPFDGLNKLPKELDNTDNTVILIRNLNSKLIKRGFEGIDNYG